VIINVVIEPWLMLSAVSGRWGRKTSGSGDDVGDSDHEGHHREPTHARASTDTSTDKPPTSDT